MKPKKSIVSARRLPRLPLILLALLLCRPMAADAQRTLSLDECRSLALDNNKELGISRVTRSMAVDARKAARTDYLPKVDVVSAYQLSSKEISLLSKDQKNTLNHLGDGISSQLSGDLSTTLPNLVQQGVISAQQAQSLAGVAEQLAPGLASSLNAAGQQLRKDFRSNNRNLWATDVMVRQPLFMGGAIKAENKIADINVRMADANIDLKNQSTLYDVDNAYWLVVSLRQKQLLAQRYLELVRKLHDDVSKMLSQGIATRANELRVAVRVNEAELTQTQVDDGLVLARMNLCQICGIDLNTDFRLEDEDNLEMETSDADNTPVTEAWNDQRPELKLLRESVELSRQNTVITRAAFLPQLIATGGYFFSTPNVYNSYQNKVDGMFHVGVTLRLPVWNWGEGHHKVRAAKAATAMAQLELEDVQEKIELQVSQAKFRLDEAFKKYNMATSNMASAEENLRSANVGFREGVMEETDVMEAQTAWQSAQSQRIDAQVDVKMAQVNLRKAMGTLNK